MQTQLWRFESFELDCGRYELRRNDRPVRVERIPMELLILLVSRNGHLVERKEIVDCLWGPGIHLDSEQGINTAVRKLRQILGDDPERPKYIQTVVGKGYRFVGEVTLAQTAPAEPASEVTLPVQARLLQVPPAPIPVMKPQTSRGRRHSVAILLAVLVLSLMGTWAYLGSRLDPVSIAVLPFENLTGNAGQEYFADGMTEEVISLLGNLSPSQLRVVARTSVMQYKGTRKPVSQIGKELGVDLVVEGSLREENGRARVTAQLIRVHDQMHLWARNYDGESRSVLTAQQNMASAIAKELQLRLTPEVEERLQRSRHIDPEAYSDYLKGRYFWNLRDEASLDKASQYFERAIARVPDFAAAYSGLADTESLLAYGNYRAPTDAFSKARAAAEKAIQLDPFAAEPHASLGYTKLYYEWDFEGAEGELRRASKLNANYAMAHDWLGYVLTARSRFPAANAEFRQALSLDPLSVPVRTDAGFELHYSGDHHGAMRELRTALELNPRFALAHFWLGRSYGAVGQCESALKELDAAEPVLHNWQPMMAARGHVLGKCGQPAQAQEILKRFAELSNTRYVTSYGVALVHAGLGQNEEALNALARAFQERSHWLVWLKLDPRFSTIRTHPRFQDLLRRVGLTTGTL